LGNSLVSSVLPLLHLLQNASTVARLPFADLGIAGSGEAAIRRYDENQFSHSHLRRQRIPAASSPHSEIRFIITYLISIIYKKFEG
jgi:hypothetical protein